LKSPLFIATIFFLLVVFGCSPINEPVKQISSDTKEIIDDCKCTGKCYGTVVEEGCLIQSAKEPRHCLEFDSLFLSHGIYGGDDDYFNEPEQDACFKTVITKLNSSEFCSQFPGNYSDYCFYSVGIKNLKEDECRNIEYRYESNCYLFIVDRKTSFNISKCYELNDEDSITCHAYHASRINDSAICLKLESKAEKLKCYSRMHENFGDDFCSGIGPNYNRICYYNWFKLAKLDKGILDEEYCEYEKRNPWDNYSCHISLAMYNKGINKCKSIGDRIYQGTDYLYECLFLVALKDDSINFNICDEFGLDYSSCYEGVIYRKANASLCKKLPTMDKKELCVFLIATDQYKLYGKKDMFLCPLTGTRFNQCLELTYNEFDPVHQTFEACQVRGGIPGQKCFLNLALSTQNISMCELTHPNWKEECINKINHVLEAK